MLLIQDPIYRIVSPTMKIDIPCWAKLFHKYLPCVSMVILNPLILDPRVTLETAIQSKLDKVVSIHPLIRDMRYNCIPYFLKFEPLRDHPSLVPRNPGLPPPVKADHNRRGKNLKVVSDIELLFEKYWIHYCKETIETKRKLAGLNTKLCCSLGSDTYQQKKVWVISKPHLVSGSWSAKCRKQICIFSSQAYAGLQKRSSRTLTKTELVCHWQRRDLWSKAIKQPTCPLF